MPGGKWSKIDINEIGMRQDNDDTKKSVFHDRQTAISKDTKILLNKMTLINLVSLKLY